MSLKAIFVASVLGPLILERCSYRPSSEILPKPSQGQRSLVDTVGQLRLHLKVLVGIALLFLASFESVMAEVHSVAGTKHDMTIYGNIFGAMGTCNVCHGPRSDLEALLSFRSKSDPVSGFQLYSSSTIDSFVNEPDVESLICLSCHDGVTAFDALNDSMGTVGNNMSSQFEGSPAIIGTDLRNDHPIGVSIRSDSNGIRDELAIKNAGLRIYNGKVECTTCHDPHGSNKYPYFLRIDPAGSPLCLYCHIK